MGSFGQYVRSVARVRELPETRGVLQLIGEELVASDCEAFCRHVLADGAWTPGLPLVLDGVRHAVVVGTLKRIVAPQQFLLVLVNASDELRRRRLADRTAALRVGTEPETVEAIDQHSTEREVHSSLPDLADLQVASTDGGDDRTDEVLRWVSMRLGRT